MNFKSDKNTEKDRYNKRAVRYDNSPSDIKMASLPKFLQSPYLCYEENLSKILSKDLKVLEIAAGMGENTKILTNFSPDLTVTDISPDSLKVINKVYKDKFIKTVVADMENLPFDDNSFDLVCSAGSLSYGEHTLVRDEIYRVLKPNGFFVCVDSLNHNYIYRFNRFVHYIRGNRTKSVIKRTPTLNLIKLYSQKFSIEKISFFGSITWLQPLLYFLIGNDNFASFSDWFDRFFNIKKSAFKFVLLSKKK